VTGGPPLIRQPDPAMERGQAVVVSYGSPSRATSVHRRVFEGNRLLYDNVWYSSYRAEPKIVRVGTKPKPKPVKPKPQPVKPKPQPAKPKAGATPEQQQQELQQPQQQQQEPVAGAGLVPVVTPP
jgi:hypothetical protein